MSYIFLSLNASHFFIIIFAYSKNYWFCICCRITVNAFNQEFEFDPCSGIKCGNDLSITAVSCVMHA